jgi:hypothetical protein
MTDQILTAHGIHPSHLIDPTTYNVRRRYRVIYYHFQPGTTWWMLILVIRKSTIATLQLLLRSNPTFMISCVMLVLFLVFNAHTKWNPFLSPADYSDVVRIFEAEHAHLNSDVEDEHATDRAESNTRSTAIMLRSIARSVHMDREQKRIASSRSINDVFPGGHSRFETKSEEEITHHKHHFNIVERVMLSTSIIVCMFNLMYVGIDSTEQYYGWERTALAGLIIAAVVCASAYYFLVFSSELCGTKISLRALDEPLRMTDTLMAVNPMQFGRSLEMSVRRDVINSEEQRKAVAESEKKRYLREIRRLKEENARVEAHAPRQRGTKKRAFKQMKQRVSFDA